MAIEYNLNGKGKYDEERRVTTYKLDSPTKNTVDNYDSVGYNENKKNTETITPSTDFESQWKEKNQGLLKYAGDSAKKSVDKGLREAPDYMKDADEGTSFENVQTASVKRNLAQDSNNDKLHQSALMEMIGHLSKDNKEDYLKHSQPLQKYIDVKDEFDFKNNNYTTTKNIDTTPDENVRQLQRELNESGYTDKFGQPLKEDGIYAGKTAYADDIRRADNPITNNSRYKTATINGKEYQIEHLIATKDDLQQKMWGNSGVKLASTNYNAQLTNYKNKTLNNSNSNNFDYNTRLSFNQTYDKKVEILQNRLVELGYLDMSAGGWGYYGPKTIVAVNNYKKDNGLGNTGKDEGVVGKDTWKSLGLLYREQRDIDNGVQIITSGRKQYFDISEAVSKALYKARDEFSKNKLDVDWFIEKVKNEGDWNIKRDSEVWQKTLNISENSYYVDKFFLYGNYINKEDLGNITYGYLGKAAGFPDEILILGSLGYHMRHNLMKDIQNELNDQDHIRTGIRWYKGIDISAKII